MIFIYIYNLRLSIFTKNCPKLSAFFDIDNALKLSLPQGQVNFTIADNFTCAQHKLHCKVTSLSRQRKLHQQRKVFAQNCHPEIASITRRLRAFLRDLLFGAFYVLNFHKGNLVI